MYLVTRSVATDFTRPRPPTGDIVGEETTRHSTSEKIGTTGVGTGRVGVPKVLARTTVETETGTLPRNRGRRGKEGGWSWG